MIDTHCHLNDDIYTDYRNIYDNFKNAGGENLICVGCDNKSNKKAKIISNELKVPYAIGVHPEYSSVFNKDEFLVEVKSATKRLVAIGEIGLDYYYEGYDREKQMKVFEEQIEIAKYLGLSIIVHCRDAYDDCLMILKKHSPYLRGGVIHCFAGSLQFAKEVINLGFLVSFTGNITYKNSDNIRSVVKELDIEKIMAETDSPYLAPVPFRGKINEPRNVKYIIQTIAELKNLNFLKCDKILTKNAKKLFNLINFS